MTDLVKRATIVELVTAFHECEASVRRCFGELSFAEKRINDVFSLGGIHKISIETSRSSRYEMDFGNPDAAIKRMTRAAWGVILDRVQVRQFLSTAKKEELDKQLDRDQYDWPAITVENVESYLRQLMAQISTLHDEAILEVFEWLRPPRSKYKRNSELEIPPAIILSHCIERTMWGKFSVGYGYTSQKLIAMENVFNALDGRGMAHKGHCSEVQAVIDAESFAGEGETPLFRFKTYKNGNLHLWFKRLDLLAKLNQKAGGTRLRPAA